MKILRNILAVIGGWAIGSGVNLGIIEIGPSIISTPEGFDNSTMDALAATIHLLDPINYISVFLAHGLGTLVGAFAAAKIAASHKMIFSMAIGGLFLLGGVTMVFMLPSPVWYTIVDLVGAYIPMAWVGWKLAGSK
ncbi:MAG: hypothetical protein JKY53_03010 [Flavobacteriales bacterium]|nr:hypothetical protein [Flavobacteriales bacterium]